MILARHEKIMQMVRQSGKVLVDELAEEFGVTSQTIRKDLNELCDRHLLLRVHGGAMLLSSVENMAYEARRSISRDQKAGIGTAAAALIPDNASLFVNIGTTTEAVARALLAHTGLMIITNNINVANVIRPIENNQVIISGGVVRASDGGIVGEAAVDFIKQFKVDYAVIGVSAIDSDGSLLDYDLREVKVAQAIMDNASNVILVADSTKHERTAPVRIGHFSNVDTFVTDRCPDKKFRKLLHNLDVQLIEVESGKLPESN